MDEQEKRRRICRFVNHQQQNTDLKQYEDIITTTIENTVPGKHPRVFSDHFSTDVLTHGEAVKIGGALSRLKQLQPYGITVTQFRLFHGRTVEASMDGENVLQRHRGKRDRAGQSRDKPKQESAEGE